MDAVRAKGPEVQETLPIASPVLRHGTIEASPTLSRRQLLIPRSGISVTDLLTPVAAPSTARIRRGRSYVCRPNPASGSRKWRCGRIVETLRQWGARSPIVDVQP